MMNRKHKIVPYIFLAAAAVVACWLFAGRLGMFASDVDWISQHSVFPDYFRRQFYETGELFPEFAASLGGGQNIYHFSYYGLYSPVILLSYLLPFIKMSDYLIAASVLSLAAAGMLLYNWLKRCGFGLEISLCCALMFLLASPMVYQSCRQIMFVIYMPFLCMAFIGVQQYWENGKTGIYTAGVFLMIMTSFYFSIAGILSLMMYGLSRYRRTEWKWPLFRFALPVLAAVCTAGILLVPTAYVLSGRSGGARQQNILELLLPDFSAVRFACSGYGIGLTTGIFAILVTGIFYKDLKERLLSAALLAVITLPFFSWVLNGGLYARDKALIPFLPLLLYMTAAYFDRLKRRELLFWTNLTGYLAAVLWCAYSYAVRRQGISTQRYAFLLFESVLLSVCFLIYWKRRLMLLLTLPPIVCLAWFGIRLNAQEGDLISKSHYEAVTDQAWEAEISDILSTETGLYRLEQNGSSTQKKDNINRVWNTRQWISSVYSSACQQDYESFCENIFQTEQPFRNALMQSVSDNPLFQKLMGVKYILRREENTNAFVTEVMEHAAPVIYATDRLISRKEYENLPFPYNQTALMQYAVIENGGIAEEAKEQADRKEQTDRKEQADIKEQTVIAPLADSNIVKVSGGYLVQSDQPVLAVFEIAANEKGSSEQTGQPDPVCVEVPQQLLYIQFDVQNNRRSQDVTIEAGGVRNRLSAENHIYYNGNKTFTYVVRMPSGQTGVEVLFGRGDYVISNIKCFTGSASVLQEDALYQSQFCPDWEKTKGNCISGKITVKNTGYLVTSIPYDKGFSIKADGISVPIQKVNTAFLGAPVRAGEHQIEITYHAPGAATGKLLSGIGFFLWAALLLVQKSQRFSCTS